MVNDLINSNSSTTQILILKAARKIFIKKGLSGARMQEIADEAGINKALLHYYYRTKDNLFNAVFMEALKHIQSEFFIILNSDRDLFDKIRFFFDRYISFLQENSFLPGFIIHEINQNPDRLVEFFKNAGIRPPINLIIQVSEEVKNQRIIPVNPIQFLLNMLSLAIFPIIASPLIKGIFEIDDPDYKDIIEQRKKELAEWFIDSIMIKKSSNEEQKE